MHAFINKALFMSLLIISALHLL